MSGYLFNSVYFNIDLHYNTRMPDFIKKLRLNPDTAKTVIDMAWPAILESFFVSLASLIDSYMVSSLGANAVAAVGITTQPKFVGMAVFFALNVSLSALVARRFGQRDRRGANEIFRTAFTLIIVLSLLIGFGMALAAPAIMRFVGSTAETHDYAVTYFRIIMGGMIFTCIQMGINSAQRGSGNTRITMRTNLVSSAVNVIFNYLLIGGNLGFPKLGILGAALATVLGTVVAAFMSIASVMHYEVFVSFIYIVQEKVKITKEAFISIIRVGYSVFFEQILMRIGFMMTALMAADQGNAAMAAHNVGMNLLSLSFAFGDGLQVTSVALIGRSLGQNNPDLAREYGKTCRVLGMGIALCLSMVYFFGGRWLYSMFFEEEEIITLGVGIVHVLILSLLFQILQVIYMGSLRGAGDTLYTAVVSTISVTLIRTAGSYFFGYIMGWGIAGIWCGILADQMGRYTLSSIRFRQGRWTQIKI